MARSKIDGLGKMGVGPMINVLHYFKPIGCSLNRKGSVL